MNQGNFGGPPPGGYGAPPPGGYGPAPPGGYGPPPPGGFGPPPFTPQLSYESTPWFRRNGINSAFVLLGFFCCPPLLWTTCVIVLTGPVYLDAYDQTGQLKTWGAANKVVAVFMILLQLAGLAARFLLRAG